MSRYFIELSFKGTRYFGWQVQPGQPTVQETLERVFSTFLREQVSITGAGRTDTGVHASFYVAHFETQVLPCHPEDLVYKLNRFLPKDIALHRIYPVAPDAHARFSATSRTYRYFINRKKNPFTVETAWEYLLPLQVDLMNKAAALLLKHSDFTSFSKLHTDVKTNNCRISKALWEDKGNQLIFTITADRFLRNMVRSIVGTSLEVGKGHLTPEGFEEIILKKDRCAAGMSVPAEGLFLTDIIYGENLYI